MRYILLFLFCSGTVYSQLVSPLSIPQPSDSMPSWCRYLYAKPLNMRALDSAYKEYYTSHPFEKNNYTRYYKRLRMIAQQYVSADGIVQPSTYNKRDEKKQTDIPQADATQWKSIGPHETYFAPESNGGLGALCPWQANIYAFDISITNPNILYAMGETGGLFKTTNKGLQWTQLETGVNSNGEAVCVHPINPSICYVGVDGGILRTNDGGKTWTFLWKMQGIWVYEIKVHNTNTQIILAGTNNGLYRSDNGGNSWKQILPNTVCDIKMAYGNNSLCYALQFDPTTKRYEFWKSADAGATFTVHRNGWLNTKTSIGGGRMTVTPADPKRIYVVLLSDSSKPYLLRSNNYGDTWSITATGITEAFPMNNGQGYYDLAIAASHTNADGVIVGTQTTYRSMDGGKTFSALGGYAGPFPIHPDLQDVKCLGKDTWIATDGGITFSTDFFAETKNAEARITGLNGADFWGFDSGWNEDVLVGGRYHNGNTAWHENYGTKYYRMGGGEAPTGYVNPIQNRHTFFSDIGSYTISPDINKKSIANPVGKFPNESYYAMEYSSMVWDPRCYARVWMGKDNILWRSNNNGQSYDSVFASPDKAAMLEHIAIARSNPNVMYVTQRSNSLWDGKIWKTTNGGTSWTEASSPQGTSGGERRVSKITVSATNEKEIWIAYRAGNSSNKVFHSINGGESWVNLTTPMIANETISDIVHQQGTNGGVYIACDRGRIFYRNAAMQDWILHGSGLPVAHFTRALKPFYRDNKLRAGSSMGIWEIPLYEHSKPIAQPCVDKFTTRCERDTFFFDDYSVLERTNNTQWQWSFPGAVYVSDTKARNPKVLYGKQGIYPVSLTVSNTYGTDTYTHNAFIEVQPLECAIDSIADKALSLSASNDLATIPAIPALKNAKGFTTTMWLKLDSIQFSFSQLLSNWSSSVGFSLGFSFQGYRKNTNMTFYWKNVPYQLTSPFNLPIGEWVHVALTVDTNKVTLYMNGEPWEYKNSNADFKNFDISSTPWEIGGGLPGQGGNYRGQIEELRIYNRPLTTEEIRKTIHLTEDNSNSALVAYYQFNESTQTHFYNKTGAIHAVNGGGTLVSSTTPVARGKSDIGVYTSSGWNFPTTGIYIPASGNDSAHTLAAYRLFAEPDTMPTVAGAQQFTQSYWIVRIWSKQQVFSADSIIFSAIGKISSADASSVQNFVINKRANSNDHRKAWFSIPTLSIDSVNQRIIADADGSIVGQYIIATLGNSPLGIEENTAMTMMQLLPNPATHSVTIFMQSDSPTTIRIINTLGQTVMTEQTAHHILTLDLSGLPTGIYTVYAESGKKTIKEQLIHLR